jgi:hypothetical protein
MPARNDISLTPGFVGIFLFVFALPFAGIGIWSGTRLCSVIDTYRSTQQWEETPAAIIHVEIENVDSGEGMSCQTKAEYLYDYKGKHYRGKRVSIHSGSDNIGSFQIDAFHELKEHWRNARLFRCYVNPADPAKAVLYRDLRWEMVLFQAIFTAAFAGAGFAMLILAPIGYFSVRRDVARRAANPGEPWLWRPAWTSGEIKSTANAVPGLVTAALIWNGFCLPVAVLLMHEYLAGGDWHALMAMILPAFGLLILWQIVFVLLRRRKFGPSLFCMASAPGVIGGRLAGVIRTSVKIRPERGFRLVLTQGSTWREEQCIVRELLPDDADRTAIPVLFQIPYACRDLGDDKTAWQLDVTAAVPGIDYHETFNVPVFATDASNPEFVPDPSAMADYTAAADPDRDLADAGVLKTNTPQQDGCRFIFPMGRHRGLAAFAVAFMLVCVAAVPLSIHQDATPDVPIIFCLFVALSLLFLLRVPFYRSVVDVCGRGLAVRGGPLGLGRRRWIAASDILRIDAEGMNNACFNIVVLLRGNLQKVVIGKWLPGPRLVNSVIRQIEQAMMCP